MNKDFDVFKIWDAFEEYYMAAPDKKPLYHRVFMKLLRVANQRHYKIKQIEIATDCQLEFGVSANALREALRFLHMGNFINYQIGTNAHMPSYWTIINRSKEETETNETQDFDPNTGEVFQQKSQVFEAKGIQITQYRHGEYAPNVNTNPQNIDDAGADEFIEMISHQEVRFSEKQKETDAKIDAIFEALGKINATLAAAPKEREISKKDLILIPNLVKYLENIVFVSDYSNTAKQKAKTRLEFLQKSIETDCFAESFEAYSRMRHKMKKYDGKDMQLSYESAMLLVQKMIESRQSAYAICTELEQATANQWRSIFYAKENKSGTHKVDTYRVATDDERRANGENVLPF